MGPDNLAINLSNATGETYTKQHAIEFQEKWFNAFPKVKTWMAKLQKKAVNFLEGIIQKYTQPSSVDRLDKTVYLPRLADKERILGKEGGGGKTLPREISLNTVIAE